MSSQSTDNPAIHGIEQIVACLEECKKVCADLHTAVRKLQELSLLQDERLNNQAAALKALQAMCRNLDQRVRNNSEGGFSA